MFLPSNRAVHLAATAIALGLACQSVTVSAQNREHGGAPAMRGGRGMAPRMEMQRAPRGYTRLEQPRGADIRPQTLNRDDFNHNYRAERGYHIGPYDAPNGWKYRQWHYGEILPRMFWAQQYWLSDYWLFGLEIPPAGYEWIRYGPDALLVDVTTGEIVQVIYGSFI